MKSSAKVKEVFEHALSFGDSEELVGHLEEQQIQARYVSWDEFDRRNTAGDHRTFDLNDILAAGAEVDSDARTAGRQAFVLPDDGNGCHVFLAFDESTLVSAMLTASAKMEDSCHV